MHLLFLDEAGTPGGDEFVLGGIAVSASRWHRLRSRWGELAWEDGRSPDVEVKWSRMQARNVEPAYRLAALVIEASATAFTVEMRAQAGRKVAPDLFRTAEDIYASALMFLAERFQLFLAREDSYGVIVIDHRNGEQDDRLRRFFRTLADSGTPFTMLDRIVDPILLSPSHHTLGIQAADLVVGPVYALCRSDEIPPSRRQLAREIHEYLLPCFARHPHTGEVDGVGIKRFPDPTAIGPQKLFDLRAFPR
jgi:hypothetical protein